MVTGQLAIIIKEPGTPKQKEDAIALQKIISSKAVAQNNSKPLNNPSPSEDVRGLHGDGTQKQSYGNLKLRLWQLSHDVMANLYKRGWPQLEGFSKSEFVNEPLIEHYPHEGTDAEKDDWSRRCVQYFQSMQLKQVVDIYQECLALHIRDEKLETDINLQSQPGGQGLHHAAQVDQIAIHLRQLADQIPATQP
jgi:hypothetical protein